MHVQLKIHSTVALAV